ncbi:MAG: OmpA family protein [Helicobacteraceae bacterium]|nr:OmpA family protein [Helicobacteraceae bacterium]
MKKLLLIPALVSALMSSDYDYELTPLIGYNYAGSDLQQRNATVGGAEMLFKNIGEYIHPELSAFYSNSDFKHSDASTNIYNVALNGVYEFEKVGVLIPSIKAGIGYETMNIHPDGDNDGAYVDAGVAVKYPFYKDVALKLEAIYNMNDTIGRNDDNIAIFAGITIPFGYSKPAPVATEEVIVVETPTAIAVIIIDADNDGVDDAIDQCLNTPAGYVVDELGCLQKVNLDINYEFDSDVIHSESIPNVQAFADFLEVNPEHKTLIVGHTDSKGAASYNMKLSERRALSVEKMLVKMGINTDRIETKGLGESDPLVSNKTSAGRAQNRRINARLLVTE